MKSLLAVLHYKPLLLSAFAWGWFEVNYVPAPMRFFFLATAMIIDLATGIVRSWKLGDSTTVEGFQRSIIKLTRYCSVIFATFILANILPSVNSTGKLDYSFLVNGTIGFLTFIEIYSIFENVYEIDPKGPVSRWLVGPILRILRGQMIKYNPFNRLSDEDKPDTSNENENGS